MSKLEILALCNFADISKSGTFNVVGIFDRVLSSKMPANLLRSFVAFTVSGNKSEDKFSVTLLISDPNDKVILSKDLVIDVGGNGKSNFFAELIGLPLSDFGRYKITLKTGAVKLGDTSFEVIDSKEDAK